MEQILELQEMEEETVSVPSTCISATTSLMGF
ncbi:class III lanthipeptide [Actinomadura decatromicini]|nr:class III lanthipeptide [Actinomadura decatromicini]